MKQDVKESSTLRCQESLRTMLIHSLFVYENSLSNRGKVGIQACGCDDLSRHCFSSQFDSKGVWDSNRSGPKEEPLIYCAINASSLAPAWFNISFPHVVVRGLRLFAFLAAPDNDEHG